MHHSDNSSGGVKNLFGGFSGRSTCKWFSRFVLLAALLVLISGLGAAEDVREWDDFEDGDYTSDPVWSEIETGGTATVQQSTVKNGDYALEIDGEPHKLVHSRTDDSISDGETYQAWVNANGDEQIWFGLTNDASAGTVGGEDYIGFFNMGDEFSVVTRSSDDNGLVFEDVTSTTSFGNWYLVEIEVRPSQSEADFRVYDSSENLIDEVTNVQTSGASNIEYVMMWNRDSGTDSRTSYWDDVSYATSPSNEEPVFNSTSIDPEPPQIGENVSYFADLTDPDDDSELENVCLDLEYGGDLVYQDCQSLSGDSASVEWLDVFTPEQTDQWLNATFTATDTAGDSTTEELNYYLDNVPPEADLSFTPDLETPGTEIQFTDQTIAEEELTSWNWDFGDGTTSTQQNPVHSYEQHGDYTVELTVEDEYGVTDTTSETVRVNSIPDADFDYSPDIEFVGQEISFEDQSTDQYSSIETVVWDFGDGTTTDTQNPTHLFEEPGTYEITQTVEDEHGATDTETVTVEVESALQAEFSYGPLQPEVDEEIEFADESGNEYAKIETVEWSFGDGTTASEPDPVHSFDEPGEYNVSLSATDEYGAVDTFWVEVIVPEESMTWEEYQALYGNNQHRNPHVENRGNSVFHSIGSMLGSVFSAIFGLLPF
ncbi:PKD domain-containing protein [Halobacteria archaeon AArc-curdl1]|uniref:PKD domain-containing protein n=1 Tax=Natronosalvus hydrolyticus TaxID=2979988 RepID=A0AAP3E9T1_9EURY|nr:PKD domain-containing protein [Halobacteria archaeon AArc-curdl1]